MNYPAGMTLRPIEVWPRELTKTRVRSPFSANWSSTMTLLDRELFHLGTNGRRAPSVLQIAMREGDFRKTDGMPRANAIASHPGVILSIIESSKGPIAMPCDKFTRWQDNLRAIALSLEALRKLDRYGTTPGNEQYRGWLAIEAKGKTDMSVGVALEVIANLAEVPEPSTTDEVAKAYKAARRNAHPDRHHGQQFHWDRVEAAAKALRAAGLLS